MTKNNFYPSFFWISSLFVMAALFTYNLGEVTSKSSGIFPIQNVVLVCAYIPDIESHTWKKSSLPTHSLSVSKKKKKKSQPTYPLLKHLNRQLQTNNFLRMDSTFLWHLFHYNMLIFSIPVCNYTWTVLDLD